MVVISENGCNDLPVILGSSVVQYSGGVLAPGDECIFTVAFEVPDNAAAGSFSSETSGIDFKVNGVLNTSSPAASTLLVSPDFTVSKAYSQSAYKAGEEINVQYVLTNRTTEELSNIGFTDELQEALLGQTFQEVLPQSDLLGDGSNLALTGTSLVLSGATLGAGQTHVIELSYVVPADASVGQWTSYLSASVYLPSIDTQFDLASMSSTLTITEPDPPTVVIAQAQGQGDPTTVSPILFSAVFSEPVGDLTHHDIRLYGGGGQTASSVTVSEVSPNDGTTFLISVDGFPEDAAGVVTVGIPAGAAFSLGTGLENSASTSSDASVLLLNAGRSIQLLTLDASDAPLSENGGITTATVTRYSDPTSELVVNLSSNLPDEAQVPASITLAAGESSATFDITAVDDEIADSGSSPVITASSQGFISGSIAVTITNDENFNTMVDNMMDLTESNLEDLNMYSSNWTEMIMNNMHPNGGKIDTATATDFILHGLTFGLKILFSACPPPGLWRGWPSFFVSLIFIGGLALIIG